jgi:hypothetical protein
VALTFDAPDERLRDYYEQGVAGARAIEALPGSPSSVVLRLEPEGTTSVEVTSTTTLPDVWDLGQHQRYGHAANLVAQLRLRGIAVRFDGDPLGESTFMLAYRAEHRARGDEPVEVLLLAGPTSHDERPPGYRPLDVSATGPGEASDTLTVPTALYVRSPG